MPGTRLSTLLSIVSLSALAAGLVWTMLAGCADSGESAAAQDGQTRRRQAPVQPDAERAFGYLEAICDIGARYSGSEGFAEQLEMVRQHFEEHGATIELQDFDVPHPLSGEPVRMTNLIVHWHPESEERILLAAHYDTRPHPDRDPDPALRHGVFLGANDGASGVALFMEMAHHMSELEPHYGVDFVLFDGEELLYIIEGRQYGEFFEGSSYFAEQYAEAQRAGDLPYEYVAAVVADMIADRDLAIHYEVFSARNFPALARSVWATAQRLGVREFIPRIGPDVLDDHRPLAEIGGIPSIVLIDFDYPAWHTSHDTPQQCAPESLEKVARVLLAWLEEYGA